MGYQPHLRITFSGALGTAVPAPEIFSFGVSAGFLLNSNVSRVALETLALGIRLRALPSLLPSISGAAKITRTRVARVTENGRVYREPDGSYAQGDDLIAVAGGGTLGSLHPPQVAVVASLKSTFAGPTGRGRFYIPLPVGGVSADTLLMLDSEAAGHQGRVAAFVAAVNTELATAGMGKVVTASQGSPVRGLPPANHVVTSVMVGRAYDTMRSRRNAMVDTRVATAV